MQVGQVLINFDRQRYQKDGLPESACHERFEMSDM